MVERITQMGILYESPEGNRRVFYSIKDAVFKLDFEFNATEIGRMAALGIGGFRDVKRVYRIETVRREVLEGVFTRGCRNFIPFDTNRKMVRREDILDIEDITLAQDL